MVASDEKLLITRSCPLFKWKFNNHVFQADFLVLPKYTFGVWWTLCSLKNFNHDFFFTVI